MVGYHPSRSEQIEFLQREERRDLEKSRDEWKERAELAERRLANLTETIRETWKEIEK